MELRYYDRDLNFIGITENQTSFIWRRRYWAVGEFEIHLPTTEHVTNLSVRGNIVTYKGALEAGIIEDITHDEDALIKETVFRGRFLAAYMDRRVIRGTTNFSGYVEVAMRTLLANATPIPKVELGELKNLPNTVRFQATYRNLLSYIQKLASTSGYGFTFRPDFTLKKIYFEVYEGVDRRRGSGNNFVEFSDDFQNINAAMYNENEQLYKNVGYVGGSGEGSDRTFVVIGETESSGLDRREVFIDAKDVREDGLTTSEYRNALAQRGAEKMAEQYSLAETFECETNPLFNFVYRRDYDLGDIVTVRKKAWGKSISRRITEIAEVYENGGVRVVPTVGDAIPLSLDTEDSSEDSFSVSVSELKSEVSGVQGDISTIQGDVTTIQGDITSINQNIQGIGQIAGEVLGKALSGVSVATGTDRILGSFTIPAGTWAVQLVVRWSSNATGRRFASIVATNSTSADPISVWSQSNDAGVNGSYTWSRIFTFMNLTAQTTFYIRGWQNSGASLTATPYWGAVRIK